MLSTAINKCCYITCRRLPPFFEYHSRVSYSKVENVASNGSIEHPSVRACLEFMGIDDGVEVHHVADLPARAGLGTSSAFTVGLLLGLYALTNQMRDKHSLAGDAIRVEQDLIGEAVGAQDQVSAAYGGFNRINFKTDGTIEVNRLITEPSRLADLENHLALYFTGFARTASEVAKEQIKITPQRKRELGAMFQMVDEGEAIIANPTRSLDDFGRLLNESWQIKRTLTNSITNANIDEIYEAGLSAGALGGKLLGAGGGGFMLFYISPERQQALRLRLNKLLCVPLCFWDRGSQVVVYEPEEEYGIAQRAERRLVYAQGEHQPTLRPAMEVSLPAKISRPLDGPKVGREKQG